MNLKPLKPLADVGLLRAYDPAAPLSVFVDNLELQEITVYPPPLFTMSPRIKVYLAGDIRKFKGYLSGFKPGESVEMGTLEASCDITIVPTDATSKPQEKVAANENKGD